MTQQQYFLGFIPYSSAITVRAVAATALASISFGAYSLHSMSSPVSLFGSSRLSMARATSAMGDILGSGAILGLHNSRQIAVVGFNADASSAPRSCYTSGLGDCLVQMNGSGSGYTAGRDVAIRGGNPGPLSARGGNGGNYAASGNYSSRSSLAGVGMGNGGYGSSGIRSSASNSVANGANENSSVGQAGTIGTASAIGGGSALAAASTARAVAAANNGSVVSGERASANAQLNASGNAAFNRESSDCGALASCESAGLLDNENTAASRDLPNSRRSDVAELRSNNAGNTPVNSRPSDVNGFNGSPLVPDAPIVPLESGRVTPNTVEFTPAANEPHNTNQFLRFVPVDCNAEPTIPACTGTLIAAQVAVVPEPSTIVLLSAGLLGLFAAHRRRSATNS